VIAAVAVALAASPLPVHEAQLANGMAVVLAPDASASAVIVHVRYEGGAAADLPGCGGCAKLAERLLHSPELDAQIDALGGWSSSEAAIDHIATTVHVPPGALARALWLESERVAHAADASATTREGAVAEIAAERRAQDAIGRVARAVQRLSWQGDPYGHLVLGAAPPPTSADVRGYLAPAHATLVIAGRFDRARADELVRRYFAALPAGAPIAEARAEAIRPRAATGADDVFDPIPKAVVAFAFAAEAADAVELAARIVASRVARKLGGRATDVHVELERRARGGDLEIVAVAAPHVDPKELAAAIEAELARLRDAPVAPDDLAGAANTLDLDLVIAFEGLAFRAAELASWRALYGHADRFDAARRRAHDVTAQAVQAAAQTWLANDVRVLGRAP